MTYSISANGHGNEGSGEPRKAAEIALLRGTVEALQKDGGNVTGFQFHGNEVNAANWDEALALLAAEDGLAGKGTSGERSG